MRAVSLVLVVAGALAAGDEVLLAPTIADLDVALARTEAQLDDARDQQGRLARAQSAFASEGCIVAACPVDRLVALIVEAEDAGHAVRDGLQSARASADRLQAIADASTIAPLLDDDRRAAVEAVQARVERAIRSYLVRSSWYLERMAPLARRHAAAVRAACVVPP